MNRNNIKRKLKISRQDDKIIIEGNKSGLKFLSETCIKLSNLSNEQAENPANHFHLMENMSNLEKGSIDTVIYLNQNL